MPSDLSDSEKTDLFISLSRVGVDKSIGYLPLFTITDILRAEPDILIAEATSNGLAAVKFGPEQCCIKSGALYVYHREALARILQAAADLLIRNGLPLDPDRFVQHIATNWFETDHPAWHIIAEAFADPI